MEFGHFHTPHYIPRIQYLTNYTGRPMDTCIILTIAVLSLIVAFAWRSATDQAFVDYFPDESEKLKAKFLYAIIVTLVTIIVIYLIAKI